MRDLWRWAPCDRNGRRCGGGTGSAILLKPIIVPLYQLVGADASMFATTLLACDMGGYPLAMQLAGNDAIGNFAGLILGTMMGPTIVLTIPVALSIISKKDRPYLGAGVLAGLITVPIGCIVGGLLMNLTPYKINLLDNSGEPDTGDHHCRSDRDRLWFAPGK